jgi:hypothetical protein
MIRKSSKVLAIGILLAGCLLSCHNAGNNAGNKVSVDEQEVQGFKTKTFINDSGNVEVTIATDGKTTIVAIPKTTISRQKQLGGDDLSCLGKCRAIDDLEKRLNCILLCPASTSWHVFTY